MAENKQRMQRLAPSPCKKCRHEKNCYKTEECRAWYAWFCASWRAVCAPFRER